MKRIPIIFDVDTGIDDATTLMMACVSDSLEILGVTATHGNNHLENTGKGSVLCFLYRTGSGQNKPPVQTGIIREGVPR